MAKTPPTEPDLEEIKTLVRAFIRDVWNGNDLGALPDLTTTDFVVHGLGAGVDRTRTEFADFHGGLLTAVPDLDHETIDLIAEGHTVVAYVRLRGTPQQQYGALAPTGKSFDDVGFQKYRIENGAIAEVWVLPNAMGMLQDLGIFPDSPGDVLRLMLRAIKNRLFG